MTSAADGRPVWRVNVPVGGWPPPWPQVIEIVQAIPHTQWTLVGGLMVQLHAAHAGLQLTRATRDVDMVLHIDSGAATFGGVRYDLERLGYALREPIGSGPVHRFVRGPNDTERSMSWLPTVYHRNGIRRCYAAECSPFPVARRRCARR